ncbi:MAG: hypothetical protein HYY44_05735 [Deltaproteobacteria bacterium]|nr:hypothetical protein [Deltaproteobacteria bacterium]MBI4374691.1 hypothetical protein [Deltaproteobacteria bacterium]
METRPLSSKEIAARLNDIRFRYVEQVTLWGTEEEHKSYQRILTLEKKIEGSAGRREQEDLLIQLDQATKAYWEEAVRSTDLGRAMAVQKLGDRARALIQEAKEKSDRGEDPQDLYEKTLIRLVEIEESDGHAWKGTLGHFSDSPEFILELADALKVERHLVVYEIEDRLREIEKKGEGKEDLTPEEVSELANHPEKAKRVMEAQAQKKERIRTLINQIYESRNRKRQEEWFRQIEAKDR